MNFNFKPQTIITTAAANPAATFTLSQNDSLDLSQLVPSSGVDQGALQEAIDDAVLSTLGDIAEGFGVDVGNASPLGGMMDDVNGSFGNTDGAGPSGLGGMGEIGRSVGGIPIAGGINSAGDLAAWANDMMNPDRVDTGAGSGDPFQQPHQNGGTPDNLNVNSGSGLGMTLISVVEAAIVAAATIKGHHHDNGLHPYPSDKAGSPIQQSTHGTQPHHDNGLHPYPFDNAGNPITQSAKDVHHLLKGGLHPYPDKSEGEGGGADGGNAPILTQSTDVGGGDYGGDLGQVYLNIGIGTSGGEGQGNSTFEDLVQALGGVVPSSPGAGEGGQGEGIDGSSGFSPVLPPYFVEHHAVLHGAVIDPIPYII
jgi:hypothetical protein